MRLLFKFRCGITMGNWCFKEKPKEAQPRPREVAPARSHVQVVEAKPVFIPKDFGWLQRPKLNNLELPGVVVLDKAPRAQPKKFELPPVVYLKPLLKTLPKALPDRQVALPRQVVKDIPPCQIVLPVRRVAKDPPRQVVERQELPRVKSRSSKTIKRGHFSKDGPGFIYMFETEFGIKIGHTNNLNRRMGEHRKCFGEFQVASFPCERRQVVESKLKKQLRDHRVKLPPCKQCRKKHMEIFDRALTKECIANLIRATIVAE